LTHQQIRIGDYGGIQRRETQTEFLIREPVIEFATKLVKPANQQQINKIGRFSCPIYSLANSSKTIAGIRRETFPLLASDAKSEPQRWFNEISETIVSHT
jgi:hypothetical protein